MPFPDRTFPDAPENPRDRAQSVFAPFFMVSI